MNTLVIAPNWIGDCLMAQPLFRLLKQQGHTLTLLAPPWVAPIFRLMPEVSAVIEAPLAHGKLQLRARWQLARQLRGQFEYAYVLPNSLKSALIPWLAGITQRIGYLGEHRSLLLNQTRPNPAKTERTPMLQHYAALAVAQHATPPHLPNPTLQVSPQQRQKARQTLQLTADVRLIGFCPGAEYGPAKRWPAVHFAHLADLIATHNPDVHIILLGSLKDKTIADEICALAHTKMHNLCGMTSLEHACALLASCTAVVSNDSGLMHITAALQRPQVALFGSSDPRHTPPHSPHAKVEWLALECSPCFKRVCPLGHFRCLNDLAPERVWSTLSELIH